MDLDPQIEGFKKDQEQCHILQRRKEVLTLFLIKKYTKMSHNHLHN